jgi:hypothetical protein
LAVQEGSSLVADGSTVDFGDISTTGAATAVRTFTIENTGSATLHLSGASPNYVLSSSVDYAVSTQPSADSLDPGPLNVATFVISFDIESSGTAIRSATISIPSDDDSTPFSFVVKGTARGRSAL